MLIFLESHDDRDLAWQACKRYAKIIRGSARWRGLGVTVKPMQVPGGLAFGVYLGRI